MKKILFLAVMISKVSYLEAGRPQPFESPRHELNETWKQYKRMKSMAGRHDVEASIRDRCVAEYMQDIDGRLAQLEQNLKQGDVSGEELAGLKECVSIYKSRKNTDAELSMDDELQIPEVPFDDDASFSDDEDNNNSDNSLDHGEQNRDYELD